MKKAVLILIAFISFGLSSYQDPNGSIEMADGLRSNGQIYVLVLIILLILAGLLFYVFTVDRKVTKMEKEVFDTKKDNIS